ncbi:hypothetical protein [Pseudobacteriovorax antillogorgiicola]|uniref:Uncharacterized protein n=1 Tax=Pseudobacteriovorax antillogorgiicola TaxID=1513793 RepID=A0A1Y6CQS5_9BACT|nr:hypothetical protein [Pseudobacteriovorax antillogorgiicola]TCS42847.1 hypothetical protein EDD56_13913 [Pseudobacteriovorax antillogorgiicola]SMF81842.1 hypothetical protein SAMN06296036_13812 [Pseudobacteriovorax antillogorgiicola]
MINFILALIVGTSFYLSGSQLSCRNFLKILFGFYLLFTLWGLLLSWQPSLYQPDQVGPEAAPAFRP